MVSFVLERELPSESFSLVAEEVRVLFYIYLIDDFGIFFRKILLVSQF